MINRNKTEEKQLPYALWIDHIMGIGAKGKQALIDYAGSPMEAYYLPDREVENLLGERKRVMFQEAKQSKDPELILRSLIKREINFYCIGLSGYPKRLTKIPDAPFGLYVKGRLPEEGKRAAAIVGARVCSGYGRQMAQEIGSMLAQAGVSVVSGMARGVDGFTQKSALSAGGDVFAVLGCGVDICYPEQNRGLYDNLKAQGGVLSEYQPGTQPRPQLFPPRNRIISGLGDLLVVVEAREKSGTLITVDMALEQGKDVYVLPGRVSDPLSAGCNHLIKQGAEIVLSVEEFIEAAAQCKRDKLKKEEEKEICGEPLLEALDFYPKSVDQIGREVHMSGPEVTLELMNLCVEGKVRQISSFYFQKI